MASAAAPSARATGQRSPRAAAHRSDPPFRVALTFDAEHPDRPAATGNQERLLDGLAELGARATFLVQGRWAEAYPQTARRISAEGHLVGNHSHYHLRMPLLTAAGLRSDIADGERAIRDATGVDPRPWFRCPFGAGVGDRRVQRVVREAGYRHLGWHVAGIDWEPERPAAEVEARVVDGAIAHGDGCVVLLHTWPDQTAGSVPAIIRRLRDAGAEFARVDELASPAIPELEVPDVQPVPPSTA